MRRSSLNTPLAGLQSLVASSQHKKQFRYYVPFSNQGHKLYCVRYVTVWLTLSSERHDAIFVVGSLEETIMLRGMRYHPIDIENSVLRCHRKICEW